MNVSETRRLMLQSKEFWHIPFMDFVDEFRRSKDVSRLKPLSRQNERYDALLASTIEHLCNELPPCSPPDWVYDIPECSEPWFIAGVESLKAISLVESPVWFRRRHIFVLENFLSRV